MLSAEPKVEAGNTYQDLDYLGYHKNLIIIGFFEYIVLKKITTNTPSQETWIDTAIGNQALRAQPKD